MLQRSGSATLITLTGPQLSRSSSTGAVAGRRKQQPLEDGLFENQKLPMLECNLHEDVVASSLNLCGSPAHSLRRTARRRPTTRLRPLGSSMTGGDECASGCRSPLNRRSPTKASFPNLKDCQLSQSAIAGCGGPGSMRREASVNSCSSTSTVLGADSAPKSGVSFRQRVSMHPVASYKDYYGMHPHHFDFDRKGEMRLTDEGIAHEMRKQESPTV